MSVISHAGGVFRAIHQELVGCDVDWAQLSPAALPPELLERARATWAHRAQTELRSVQVMTRFLGELLGAGDPLEVYAGAAAAVIDEIRHTALCVGVVEALGVQPRLPEPLEEPQHPEFSALPPAQRALGTAVSMLLVSETLSVALIEDLRARCSHPTLRAVLDATLADETEHDAFGWHYVRTSLSRFDQAGVEFARLCAETALEPHLADVARVVGRLAAPERRLEAWPEPELAALGLMSDERQALVLRRAIDDVLLPRLRELGIAPS